ncbi:MAG: hypothetical protein IT168_06545 [Bryobacterales bacterium]|nr:hypothetical protein [Bryobacterales bacterium]
MTVTNSYVRAIRGPVLLIVLGVLLLIDFAGSLSFWRSWPALLVVMGLMILLERVVTPGYPTAPPPPPGAGGV